MNTREAWYRYYRLTRIARREAGKASEDLMIFGTGVCRVESNGEVWHVPLRDFLVELPKPVRKARIGVIYSRA